MNCSFLRTVCILLSLLAVPCLAVQAQGPPPGSPGGPGHPGVPPGGPGNGPGGGPGTPGSPASRGPGNTSANAAVQRNGLHFGPVGRWWDDKSVVLQIGLRKEQQKKMDSIFNAHKPAILANYKAYLKAQTQMSAVTKDANADKSTVFAAIDAVNSARGDLQKTTSDMLLQIRHQMDSDQITKLEKLP